MKTKFLSVNRLLLQFGWDIKKMLKAIRHPGVSWFIHDWKELKRQKGSDTTFEWGRVFPVLGDRYDEGGTMKGHYFHQDLYVARKIFEENPRNHLDIGSRVDGFVAHVASFRVIELMDIRPIQSKVRNIVFRQADLMAELQPGLIGSFESVSSLHVAEHLGLGRYGDPIDYFGYLKALDNIEKILVRGGTFYFSVPIGAQRIEFNAHRVFSVNYLLSILTPKFHINHFSFVDGAGDFHEEVELTDESIKSNFNCQYGCGIFVLTKK